jgi:hypothetical protein
MYTIWQPWAPVAAVAKKWSAHKLSNLQKVGKKSRKLKFSQMNSVID